MEMISSVGLLGVVSIVYPIHAHIAIITVNTNSTGVAISHKSRFAQEPKSIIGAMYGS